MRVGRFDQANQYFSQNLTQHLRFAPVFLECADALLIQGRFGSLSKLLKKLPPGFDPDRDQLSFINLMRQLANIYVSGALLELLDAAKTFKASMLVQAQWDQCSIYQVS